MDADFFAAVADRLLWGAFFARDFVGLGFACAGIGMPGMSMGIDWASGGLAMPTSVAAMKRVNNSSSSMPDSAPAAIHGHSNHQQVAVSE